ncbi:hypothetical protein FisN_5Hh207 [Fistulifera solaris]|jgi:hypothetical protein|uniref:Uncharacterized protein n=1 Tax=Fistulifera solaris TaxID=1519565 RepID=A0A1Z5JS35_FISSO|nr:hypothetical protein FisN_5Hh207 [Fistulifera solaris]|eukprot:GAX16834.1 hypothetical protein FisN_5Hh207 [Fistulifera solaris]
MTLRLPSRRLFVCVAVSILCLSLQLLLFFNQQSSNSALPTPAVLAVPDFGSRPDCLLQDACMDHLATKLSRVWSVHNLDAWCRNVPKTKNDSPTGLVLIKVPKSASSTLAGVVLRIQNRHNCTVHWQHKLAREYSWNGDDASAIRVAPIREPSSRAMSSVYFHYVSFHKNTGGPRNPKDSFIIQKLRETKPDFILDYTADKELVANVTNGNDRLSEIYETIRRITTFYDFLFVVDRLDESLLVYSWLTKLPWTDLLTMPSKKNGSWYLSGNRCVSLAGASLTPAIATFFESVEWKQTHAGDRLLYEVANRSLDRTIDELIGRPSFEKELFQFRDLRRQIENACQNETNFPCSQNGSPQLELAKTNCYVRDFGCGYPCIDRFANEMEHS